MVVVARSEEHQFVSHLLSQMAHLRPGECQELPDPLGNVDELGLPVLKLAEKTPPGLAAALKAPVNAQFEDAPLGEALTHLATQAKTTLILDPAPRLFAAKVTLKADKLTLGQALQRLTKSIDASILTLDHALLVTTPERARRLQPAPWMIYDVRNVLRDGQGIEALADRVRRVAEREPGWAPSHHVFGFRNVLVVRTTPAIHARIRETLR
jgi:hypothetical protein